MKRKLWNKDFILLLQGNAVSAVGDLLYGVAIGYWVYEKTGSSALMGVMSSISMFVTMFLSPFTGSIVDKCSRRWMIVGMDALRGMLMLAVGVLAFADKLTIAWILLTAFLAALCSVFFSPAVNTLMIDLIPHDDMVRGQSIHSGLLSLINMVGKAFSGVLVAALGVPLIVLLNGVSYLISAFTELFIHVPRTVQQGEKVTVKGILHDFGRAVRAIFADKFLRTLVPALLLLNLLCAGPMTLMLPFCMEKGFSMEQYGLLMSIEMAASFLCVAVMGVVKLSSKARFRLQALGFTGSLLIGILGYLSTGFVPLSIFLFVSTALNTAGNTILNASLMLALPDENRGAILGFISAASTGGCALSAVIYGLLGDIFPLYLVFVAGNVLTLLPMACVCFHPYTREFLNTH